MINKFLSRKLEWCTKHKFCDFIFMITSEGDTWHSLLTAVQKFATKFLNFKNSKFLLKFLKKIYILYIIINFYIHRVLDKFSNEYPESLCYHWYIFKNIISNIWQISDT